MATRLQHRGFALLMVLWVLVLLSAIALHVTAIGRTEARIARNIVAAAKAEALADGAVADAIRRLLDGTAAPSYGLELAEGSATITIADENGKLNPNIAPPALVAALLEVHGLDRHRARRLAAALHDWVDTDEPARAAKDAEYRRVGRSHGPPGTPAASIDEFPEVLGMTAGIMALLRPELSVLAAARLPDAAAASPALRQAIDAYMRSMDEPQRRMWQSLPPAPRVFAITAEAHGAAGAVFIRKAVVRLDPAAAKGYAVLAWERGEVPGS